MPHNEDSAQSRRKQRRNAEVNKKKTARTTTLLSSFGVFPCFVLSATATTTTTTTTATTWKDGEKGIKRKFASIKIKSNKATREKAKRTQRIGDHEKGTTKAALPAETEL